MEVLQRTRRTQAERTAETRSAIIDATIRLLCRVGYAGTTTTLIPEEAGVSRGAYLHQFGTRADLMIEVVRSVYAQEVHDYRAAFANPDHQLRLAEFPEVIWEVVSRPSGMAVLEILNGSRNDPELAERLLPIQDEIERNSLVNMRDALKQKHPEPFDPDPEALLHVVRLIVWAARGLSVLKGMGKSQEELTESIKLLRQLFESAEDGWMRAHLKVSA